MDVMEKLKLIQQITRKSQEALAHDLGVSFPTLNSWINGKSVPRLKAQALIDEVYQKLTGQKVIPVHHLEAKKKIILDRRKKCKNVLSKILSRKDVFDEYILSLTYNSNRIEGNTLTEDETAAILFQNAALSHKSMIEQLEAKNHETALRCVFNHIHRDGPLNEELLLRLHGMLLNGIRDDAGFYRRHSVRIVGAHVPTANFIRVPQLMDALMNEACRVSSDVISHVSEIHSRFEKIHPFSDGNGRIGRLLMHAMFLHEDFPPAVIKQERRREYILALNKAQTDEEFSLLEDFICDALLASYDLISE